MTETTTRRFRCTFRCVGTRADRHQCRRTVTGVSDESAHLAEQAAVDQAVLTGWAPRGALAEAPVGDWMLAAAHGLLCPRHAR